MPRLEYHLHSLGKEVSPTSWSQMKTSPMPPYHWAPSFQHGSLGSMDRHPHAVSSKHLKMHASVTKRAIFRLHCRLPQLAWTASVEAKGWADPGIRGWCCHWVWHHSPTKNCLRGSCLSVWRHIICGQKPTLQQKSHELLCGNGWGQKQTSTKWWSPHPWEWSRNNWM